MKKFSELDKINENHTTDFIIIEKPEVEFLLNTLNSNTEDIEDIFIGFLDNGDHYSGINLEYFIKNSMTNTMILTMVNKEDLRSDYISKIRMTIYFQSKSYNLRSYYSNTTKETGLYSKNEMDLISEYILGLKRLLSILKTDKVSFNTKIEQLAIKIEFENSDEILNGLKELKELKEK